MTTRLLAILLCFGVLILSGCALTTDRIELQYEQQQNVEKLPGANDIYVNVEVDDIRRDQSRVGSKKNGFGVEMAPIVAVEDVAVTVRRALEQELTARGFQLASLDAASVQIEADITRFYNDFKMGFWSGDAVADLNMGVLVKAKNGELLYQRQILVKGVESGIQLATGGNAKRALDKALQKGIGRLFRDQEFLSALTASSVLSMEAK